MNRILILFAHPALEKSRVQRRLIKAAEAIDEITIHDLYETYPDFMIDVPAEQSRLLEHDLILFQHPLYWYSCPSLLKEWLDLVLEYGFAYGREGDALNGKTLGSIISSGGSRHSYSSDGRNHYSMRELLQPFDQTARLCGMQYLPPFTVHRTHDMHDSVIDNHAEQYRQILWRLQRGLPSQDEIASLEYLNDWAAN
ncbi:NAD(P)H oxidoreductase [Leucothrix sargassi]|nr:NAD(P)H oxidoreductase [Leucothrix sargassi]